MSTGSTLTVGARGRGFIVTESTAPLVLVLKNTANAVRTGGSLGTMYRTACTSPTILEILFNRIVI